MPDRGQPIDGLFRRIGSFDLLFGLVLAVGIGVLIVLSLNTLLGVGFLLVFGVFELLYFRWFSSGYRCRECRLTQKPRGPEPWTCRKCSRVGWAEH